LHPRHSEQKRIAEILSTVDEAIEQTEALIAKYQQIKAGLMHDLFTRGVTPDGRLRPTRILAPHLYKESPLGWIPKEWEVKPLSAFTQHDITYGIVQAGPHVENGVPYIRTGDMAGDRLVREDLLCTSRIIADSYKRSEVRSGEIVCAIRATVGKVLRVPSDLDGANLTQGTARIAPNSKTDPTFLLWAIRSERTQRAIS
jgi:type I restriction enzyme S subunit